MSEESFECELCTDKVYIADNILELNDYRCACGYLCCNKCRVARGDSKRGREHHHSACEEIEKYEQIITTMKEEHERSIARMKDFYEEKIAFLERMAAIHEKFIDKCFKRNSISCTK